MVTKTKLVLLGTGTPNAEAQASGCASAVVVDNKAYLIDFGAGVVRQASKAFQMGIDALNPKNLKTAFCTHLHSDHTTGLADLIFTPWVLERDESLKIYGPKGIKHMAASVTDAYKVDIDFRINGFERANTIGYKTDVHEITDGVIYQDELVTVEAFTAVHGTLECYSYKFTTPDKVIVISGDTCPTYLITYHRIYHTEVQQNKINITAHLKNRELAILEEIKSIYHGAVSNGQDLDVYI